MCEMRKYNILRAGSILLYHNGECPGCFVYDTYISVNMFVMQVTVIDFVANMFSVAYTHTVYVYSNIRGS